MMHNIVEYKSPDDSMNVNTYLKVLAYAYLYKSYEEHVDDIGLNEITITLVRERNPVKLFQWFAENGYKITEKENGIFYIMKEGCFPTQILVSRKLSKENQKWLTLLSRNLEKTDAERAVLQIEALQDGSEKNCGDSVLQVAMKENEQLFKRMKEEGKEMCQALRELFEPELKEAVQQGMQQGIRNTILKFLNAGSTVGEISKIMEMPLEEVEAIAKGE